MAKCKDCGFLAIWRYVPEQFSEASEYFRTNGNMETDTSDSGHQYQPKCFSQRAPLQDEIFAIRRHGHTNRESVLNVLNCDRPCKYAIPWRQGFTPKEHQEMMDQEELYRDRQRHEWRTLEVAIFGACASAIGIWVGANINLKAAQMQADAQDRSTRQQIEAQKQLLQMQIDSQKESSRQVPPLNVTVTLPDGIVSKKKAGP